MSKINLKIIQNNTNVEQTPSEVVEKLYNLTYVGDGSEAKISSTSDDIVGSINIPMGYKDVIDYVREKFPNLSISVTDNNYCLKFEDENVVTYLNSIGIGSNGMVTMNEAAATSIVANSVNTAITKFNELKYFTKITGSRDGWTGSNSGYARFYNWTALEEVDISNYTSIGHQGGYGWEDTFNCCTALKTVTASSLLSKIGYNAFRNCIKLEVITGLEGILEISACAFQNCNVLTDETFTNCSIFFNTYAPTSSFENCYALTTVNISETSVTIGSYAFKNCRSLTSIGTNPFANVTSIGNEAFYGCTSLTTLNISSSVSSIGSGAFCKCSNLASITFNSTTPPTLSGSSWFDDTNNCPIYVPSDVVDTYKAADGWSNYADRIQAIS